MKNMDKRYLMEFKKHPVNLKIRRFDLSDNPEIIDKTIDLSPNMDFNIIKRDIAQMCNIDLETKVIKLKNEEECFVTYDFLTRSPTDGFFYIDIANVNYLVESPNFLQEAYVDAVSQKIKHLESRIAQTEMLLPQLEWRRQAYMEDTVAALTNKMLFLNRRYDELYPKYKAQIQVSEKIA